jgi:nucleoside-diphosphate-sugar epimerase
VERIKKATGWEPKTSLTEALQVIIESERAKK